VIRDSACKTALRPPCRIPYDALEMPDPEQRERAQCIKVMKRA